MRTKILLLLLSISLCLGAPFHALSQERVADTMPPTAPTSLTATASSATEVNLSWTASTDNVGVTGYRVESCTGARCIVFTQIATTTGTSYSDTGLSPSTSYSYQVKAMDAAGNMSGASAVASATTEKAKITHLKDCLMERPLFGDLAGWRVLSSLSNWSIGTAVSTQLVRYNFSTKQASSLQGVGGGPSFRYFGYSMIGDEDAAKNQGFTDNDLKKMKTQEDTYDKDKQQYRLPIYKIKPECRAKSEDFGKDRSEKLAASMFSITPTFYISKLEDSTDLSVQPALLLGLFDDVISIGYGFNLTGPHQGRTFLVFGLGLGFKF